MIRRLNDIIRALLMQASLPPTFWVEALHTAAYLHNILPTKRLNFLTPTFALYLHHHTYDHLQVFGCACYPNLSATSLHKLHSRSTQCIFVGYPNNFRGYRCYDPISGRIYLSHHVIFNESLFPSSHISSTPTHILTSMDSDPSPIILEPLPPNHNPLPHIVPQPPSPTVPTNSPLSNHEASPNSPPSTNTQTANQTLTPTPFNTHYRDYML